LFFFQVKRFQCSRINDIPNRAGVKNMIIGLDVGGTHTDVVLIGDQGVEKETKVITDHSNLFNTVLTGLDKVTEGIDHKKINRIVLSTTLTTNAIVQNKLAPVGMIVAGGPGIDPTYYRTSSDYYCVKGSIDHRGRETEPVNPSEIKQIRDQLKKNGIRYVGIVSKFSVRNPQHELAINKILGNSFEKVFMGHQVSGKLNFPRRIATAFINAAVYPIHKDFFEAVRCSLNKKGFTMPIHILKADGGTMTFDSSVDSPCQTILSGPAASVMGSIAFASRNEENLVLDIGGTTTDMAVLIDRVPVLNPLGIQLDCYKSIIRSLATQSIGIGGDSHVRIENGELKVGPERMGPALAYGGPLLTPTDALVALDIIPELNKDASIRGLKTLAETLNLSVEQIARKIFDQTCNEIVKNAHKMVREINSKPVYTVHEVYEDYTVKLKKVLVLGGPAQHFAPNLEKLFNLEVKAVPRWSVANAIGAALARTTCEVTLFADTEQGKASAPEENFFRNVSQLFSKEDAIKIAYDLLKEKAVKRGADPQDLDMEVLEDLEFNMVRGFYTTGKNIRIKVQVKPGLIHGYDQISMS
jgi:N-methylhydantoinase A